MKPRRRDRFPIFRDEQLTRYTDWEGLSRVDVYDKQQPNDCPNDTSYIGEKSVDFVEVSSVGAFDWWLVEHDWHVLIVYHIHLLPGCELFNRQ